VAEAGLAELITVGADAKLYADAAQATPGWTGRARGLADVNEASALLVAEVGPGDVVLVKASNSERLWRVADALVDSADRSDSEDPDSEDPVRA
jgi:UDP-N-acetylmuramoyl-tripeptide--D-alanyl-D-alanine ligase